ncbi:hypothetical protein [Flavobacterium sp. 140616W15]|uniref:hypothetical protein n=1 Tax=Flavobacterium sp. 140616W15 TaxID=2478552 RepID=UPI000F0C050A|nr:hypothetical protein [Flavobacterium sp. 140616W15]AYN04397.1 hypothetical protein EAG11_09550 [Flavobacterium sp. 140616W15]
MENNYLLFDVDAMIDAYIRQNDKERTKVKCINLLKFCFYKNLLLKNPFNEKNELESGIIRESDLTELGLKIFEKLSYKWLVYTDKNDDKIDRINNIKMLEKYYDKLLKDYESKK